MLRNHGPDDAYQNMYPVRLQNTGSLLSSSPSTAAISHRNPVSARIHYKKGAVLRLIKETHNIELVVQEYF
jgi:hypothetical protein